MKIDAQIADQDFGVQYAQSRVTQEEEEALDALGPPPTVERAEPLPKDGIETDSEKRSAPMSAIQFKFQGQEGKLNLEATETPETGAQRQNIATPTITAGEEVEVSEELSIFGDVTTQAIGGVRDAIQGVLELVEPIGDILSDIPASGDFRIGKDGKVEAVPEKEVQALATAGKLSGNRFTMPDVPEARTTVGALVRGVVQFAAGFKGVSQLAKVLKAPKADTKRGKVLETMGKSAIADILVFNKDQENLSSLIEQFPTLQNPVTEFLASEKDDGALEAKLKAALEGSVAGLTIEGAVKMSKLLAAGIRAMKKKQEAWRLQKKGFANKRAEMEAVEQNAAGQAKRDILFLGDPQKDILLETMLDSPMHVIAKRTVDGNLSSAELAGMAKRIEDVQKLRTSLKGRRLLERVRVPNFAKINGDEDIDAVLSAMQRENEKILKGAKGGVVSREVTAATGRALGIKELMSIDPKTQGITAARLSALKDFYAASAKMLKLAAKKASENPSEGNLFNFNKMLGIHNALLERFGAARSEAGRALNVLQRASDAGDKELLSIIEGVNNELGGPEAVKFMADKIASAPGISNEALNNVATGFGNAARRGINAIQEAWTLGLVSGLRTQGRNILSNAFMMFAQMPVRAVAARLPGAEVARGEALAMLGATMYSIKQAFVNAGKAFWHGTSGFGIGKVDTPRGKSIGGDLFNLPDGNARRFADAFGELWRIWGRGLVAGDEFFKTLVYNQEIAAQAHRRAVAQGLRGRAYLDKNAELVKSPNETMRIEAREAARRGTFTEDPGIVAKAALKMKRSDNMAVRIAGIFMTPFVTTVANITRTGFSYTPLGVAMPRTFWKEIAKGGAAKDVALAKLTFGSAVMSLFADGVMRGTITGNGPSDPVERANWLRAGHRPYSMLIGDEWVDFRSIEPLGTMAGLMSDVVERMIEYSKLTDSDDPDREQKMNSLAIATIAAVGNSITSQSFSRGLSEFFTVMANPQMYAESYLEGLARSTVPRIIKSYQEIAGITGADEWKDVQGAMEAIKAELDPATAFPVRDVHGHPRTRAETLPRRSTIDDDGLTAPLIKFLSAASPVWVGDANGQPIDQVIFEQGIRVRKPQRRQIFEDLQTGESVTVNLRQFPEIYDALQRLEGHEMISKIYGMNREKLLNQIVTGQHDLSSHYNSLPDGDERGVDDKGKFIKSYFNRYRDEAKRLIMSDPKYKEFQDHVLGRALKQTKAKFGERKQ